MILPDYLRRNLDVVFCGTAAGERSAAFRHYYSDSRNKFWRTLHEIGLTSKRLAPENDNQVMDFGIGLTDLVKMHFGSDRRLRPDMYDIPGFEAKIIRFAPRVVAFNGKEAPSAYLAIAKSRISFGLQGKTINGTAIFVLPSTSGSAGKSWDADIWHELVVLARGK